MDDRTITMTEGHDRLATVGSDRSWLTMLNKTWSCVLRTMTVFKKIRTKKMGAIGSHSSRINLLFI